MGADFLQGFLPVDCVKGILKVQFQDDLVGAIGVPRAPLVDAVDRAICPKGRSNTYLPGPKMSLNRIFGFCAKNLAYEAADQFPYRYWAQTPRLLL